MSTPANELQTPIEGEGLDARAEFWLETARGMVKQSIASIEEAAKQVIAIASLSQAIYFAAISLNLLRPALAQFTLAGRAALAFALVSPLVCWVVALYFAIRVFKPETYHTNLDSPEEAEKLHRRVVSYKHRQLQAAYWFLALGFVPLVLNVLLTFFIL